MTRFLILNSQLYRLTIINWYYFSFMTRSSILNSQLYWLTYPSVPSTLFWHVCYHRILHGSDTLNQTNTYSLWLAPRKKFLQYYDSLQSTITHYSWLSSGALNFYPISKLLNVKNYSSTLKLFSTMINYTFFETLS